jgi:hypothetical protein
MILRAHTGIGMLAAAVMRVLNTVIALPLRSA